MERMRKLRYVEFSDEEWQRLCYILPRSALYNGSAPLVRVEFVVNEAECDCCYNSALFRVTACHYGLFFSVKLCDADFFLYSASAITPRRRGELLIKALSVRGETAG